MFATGELKIWSTGKNKYSDQRIMIMGQNISKTKLSNPEKYSGENCGMFGKNVKDIWIEKYGEEKALEMWTKLNKRRIKNSLIKNSTNNTIPCLQMKTILYEIFGRNNILEEFSLYDDKNDCFKFYDAYVPELKMLFECDGNY